MSGLSSLSGSAARFARCRNGSVSIIFGLLTILLFGVLGAAVDYTRLANAKARTTDILDSAVLAAGRHLQMYPDDVNGALAMAQTFFNEEVKSRLELFDEHVAFTLIDDDTAIKGSVTAKLKSPLLGVFHDGSLPLKVETKAMLASGSKLELALMLDVTGSMCSDGQGPCDSGAKLDALKSAANDLINVVVRSEGSQDARVALVPFSERVRVGGHKMGLNVSRMKPLTNQDPTWSGWYKECTASTGTGGSETTGTWACTAFDVKHKDNWKIMPCVTDRTGPQALTDAAPGPNAWLNAHGGTRFPLSNDSSDTPYTWGGLGATAADPATQWDYEQHGDCEAVSEKNVIKPLSSDKSDLMAAVDDLEAYGSTAGALGTAWSWYMLSPNWSSIWTGQSTPGAYEDMVPATTGGTPKLRKVAVLMTDGVYNTHRGWADADKVEVSNNAVALCTAMKAKGIEIYTVGFNLDEIADSSDRSRAYKTLKDCSNNELTHFYDAVDTNRLQTSFRDIAARLAQLYLAQ